MSGSTINSRRATPNNEYFRQVLFTGPKSQLVVMALCPGEEIGPETRSDTGQFIRLEAGQGQAVIDG
jgi:hypothetical protein